MAADIDGFFCKKACSKWNHLCTRPRAHSGRCSHTYVSRLVTRIDPKAGNKLRCDSYTTPGNKGAAKNRADRCYLSQYSKEQIFEANQQKKKGVCIPKRFASTPSDCFKINIDLAAQILSIFDLSVNIGMFKAEDKRTLNFLCKEGTTRFPTNLTCRICSHLISIRNFYTQHASSGEKSAQLGHIDPYIQGKDSSAHVAHNVQWIHRDCNIIQGEKTEKETFEQLAVILRSQGWGVTNPEAIHG